MLNIRNIHYSELKIPFTSTFSHGSADRNETETVIVEITDEKGGTGYGEGCPRSYVTGESIETAFGFLERHLSKIYDIRSIEDIITYIKEFQADIDHNPAAWCAMELALLDLLAKTEHVNLETLLGRTKYQSAYVYSAILGNSEPEMFHKLFQQYYQLGFVDFKIKLSNDIDRDREKLVCMKEFTDKITVRADANNLWGSIDSAINYLNDLSFDFIAIEEPIKSKNINDLSVIAEKIDKKIILDESLLRFDQIQELIQSSKNWIVNARVSKYGGLIRSLKIIDELVRLNIDIIVGAHVGETSLLTRTALIMADAATCNLKAQEGGFSTHLLTKDPFEPNLKIGKHGMFSQSKYQFRNKAGLGIEKVHG